MTTTESRAIHTTAARVTAVIPMAAIEAQPPDRFIRRGARFVAFSPLHDEYHGVLGRTEVSLLVV